MKYGKYVIAVTVGVGLGIVLPVLPWPSGLLACLTIGAASGLFIGISLALVSEDRMSRNFWPVFSGLFVALAVNFLKHPEIFFKSTRSGWLDALAYGAVFATTEKISLYLAKKMLAQFRRAS